jgi:O-antigen/teichoic acid export membrane protein
MVRALTLRLIYQVIGAIAALVFGTLTARWLGPHDKGLVSLVALISFMVSLFGALGVNEAVAYLRNREGFTAAEVFAGLAVLTLAWGGVLGFATGWVVYRFSPTFWHVAFPLWLAVATGLLSVLRLFFVLGKSHLLAEGRYELANWLDVAYVVLPILALFPLVWWRGATVWSAIISTLLATLAVVLPLAGGLWRYRGRVSWTRGRTLARKALVYSARAYARLIGATLLYRVNVFLVGALLDIRAVGWYAIALMFSEVLLKIPDAVTWMLAPRVARTVESEVNAITARYLRWTLAVSAVTAVAAAAVIPWLVPRLLSEAYRPAVLPSLLLLPGVLCACVYQLLASSLIGRGQVGSSIAPTWFGVAAMVGLNLLAIPRWGLNGAAASASLAYAIAAAGLLWSYRATAGAGIREMFLLQPVDRIVLRQGWRRVCAFVPALRGEGSI